MVEANVAEACTHMAVVIAKLGGAGELLAQPQTNLRQEILMVVAAIQARLGKILTSIPVVLLTTK